MPPKLEDFFRLAPCFITVQGPDLRIIAANDRFIATFGTGAGKPCYGVYKGLDEPCEDCPVRQTFADGRPHTSKQVVRLPGGARMPIIAYSSPVFGEGGEVEAVIEVSADITEQRQLERELEESREQFRLLFEDAPCYISVQDRDLRIVRANRRFAEAFGQGVGGACHKIYKHRGEPCLVCPVAETFADGQTHHSEEVVVSLEGETINTLVSTAPITNEAGEIELVMEMSTDITRVRQLQGQLTNLGLLIGSMSHGLRGLLTGLDGGSYLINSGLQREQPARIEQGWKMVQRNIGHIRRVVMDLLYLAGEDEVQLGAAPLGPLVTEAAQALQPRVGSLGVAFSISIEDQGGVCEVDPRSLKESLINILEYCFEACRIDACKQEHRVSLRLTWDASDAQIQIADNGVGMDQEAQEKIFSLFFATEGSGGTSLGLFTASKVIEKHRGIIEVKSAPSDGTTFSIRLPRAPT